MNVIDWILNLFRDHNAASAFVMAPGQVMTDAGLGGISPVQLASVADVTVPSLDRAQWEHLQRVLADTQGNISEAARRLGMHRRSLQRKLQKLPPKR